MRPPVARTMPSFAVPRCRSRRPAARNATGEEGGRGTGIRATTVGLGTRRPFYGAGKPGEVRSRYARHPEVRLRLSKSRYVAGLRCDKLLWLQVNEPAAPELVPTGNLIDAF